MVWPVQLQHKTGVYAVLLSERHLIPFKYVDCDILAFVDKLRIAALLNQCPVTFGIFVCHFELPEVKAVVDWPEDFPVDISVLIEGCHDEREVDDENVCQNDSHHYPCDF